MGGLHSAHTSEEPVRRSSKKSGRKEDGRVARFPRRGRFPGGPRGIGLVVVLLLLVAGGVWFFWLRDGNTTEQPAGASDSGEAVAAPVAPADSAPALPPLDASDAFVRDMVAELSSRPRLAEWLATDHLVRRFVGAVVSVAAGTSPRTELEFMEPEGDFRVASPGRPAAVDPASYRRYDPIAETFVALDTDGTAELYRRLQPLFQEAYRELGFSESTFDGAMARAVETLLAVPVPDEPIQVVSAGTGDTYVYRDPELEELSPAQKHLLRMGPDNVRRVQAKLRELADALDLPMLAGSGE